MTNHSHERERYRELATTKNLFTKRFDFFFLLWINIKNPRKKDLRLSVESRDNWEYQQFGACEKDCFLIPNQFRIESKRRNLHSRQKNAFIFTWITIAASTAFVCVCVSRFKMKLLHGNVFANAQRIPYKYMILL